LSAKPLTIVRLWSIRETSPIFIYADFELLIRHSREIERKNLPFLVGRKRSGKFSRWTNNAKQMSCQIVEKKCKPASGTLSLVLVTVIGSQERTARSQSCMKCKRNQFVLWHLFMDGTPALKGFNHSKISSNQCLVLIQLQGPS